MRVLFSLTALVLLAQCKTFHLPKPGEPVRTDIDDRGIRIDESENDVRYADPAAQSAFDAGYDAGYLDHQRRKPSDPDAHPGHSNNRPTFIAGYLAGFAK